MTLQIKPEHNVVSMHQEPRVTHIHFRNEAGERRFIDDNRAAIKSLYERWNADWEPMLTVTAR